MKACARRRRKPPDRSQFSINLKAGAETTPFSTLGGGLSPSRHHFSLPACDYVDSLCREGDDYLICGVAA